ncbi:MAG: MarR family transcriptional regulator [Lachnospiraceae bacterium]|nr:MarR family transcriptional regulator [Lachnospiraceae bacterium]
MSREEKQKSLDRISGDEALKLENQICFPLYAAARKVTGAYTPFLKPLGITYTQYLVFLVLWEQDGIPVGALGQALHLDTGTLTPLLKKMEAAGFLTRQRRKDDERSVEIRLTEKGRALKEKARDIPGKIGACFTGALSGEDAAALYRILYQILKD